MVIYDADARGMGLSERLERAFRGAGGAPCVAVMVVASDWEAGSMGAWPSRASRRVWAVKPGPEALVLLSGALAVSANGVGSARVVDFTGGCMSEEGLAVSRACGMAEGVALTWRPESKANPSRLERFGKMLMASGMGWRGAAEPSTLEKVIGELAGLVEAGVAAGPMELPAREDARFFEVDSARLCLALFESLELGGAAGDGDVKGPGRASARRL